MLELYTYINAITSYTSFICLIASYKGEMQSEEMSFQSAFERGQRLGCPDVYRKVIPPSWGQNREQSRTRCAGVTATN